MGLNFFRPKWDPATNYSYRWCGDVIAKARDLGYQFKELAAAEATRENMEESMPGCNCFIFYDHGAEKYLYAQDGDVAVDENNYNLFSGVPIYLLACLFGAEGAQKTVDAGAPVIWAYNRSFGFFPHMESYFKEQANIGVLRLLEGFDFAQARRAFLERCQEMKDELDRRGQSMIADQILYNMESLVLPGDATVRLRKIPPSNVVTVMISFLEDLKSLCTRALEELKKIKT